MAEVHSSAAGPGSAQTAEIIYGPDVEDAVLAAGISIHRSTLKYRLKRVRELLGQDLNNGSTRLDLHLATRVWLTLESLRRTEQA